MKKFFTVSLLLVCSLPFCHGQTSGNAKPEAHYPIKVHISGSTFELTVGRLVPLATMCSMRTQP